MLLGSVIVFLIFYKIASFLYKDGEASGIRKYAAYFCGAVGTIAIMAVMFFAFSLWWILLILWLLFALGCIIYAKIKEKNE